ncbi:hypothetical protein BCR34DRAFT_594101 [Clohesyomyces aquaticus]|uniref:Secreted protein n=1 Tax=Clohesyomyces aquaticus TaxID=1231657 RepID=A0A1Y1YCE4_9PLEO|nr:hypothetical protein BCR34DRAFT_594101 [Clohesyomyces aquaticus]
MPLAYIAVLLLASFALAADTTERRNPGTTTLVECFFKEVPGFQDSAVPSILIIKKCMAQLDQKRLIYCQGVKVKEISTKEEDGDVSGYVINNRKKNDIVV